MNDASAATQIASRDNALFKDLRRLAQDNTGYRKQGRVWLEGDHLCRAALGRGIVPVMAVFAAGYWPEAETGELARKAQRNVVVADALWAQLSGLESPAPMAFVLDLPDAPAVTPGAAAVVLDRLQDAGNVGSVLRSAAAFGFQQVIALKGTAALWSPKVLRAGMGAHFAMDLIEGVTPEVLDTLGLPLLATSSHQGDWLHSAALPWPCAWAFGHEGQGIGDELQVKASAWVRIAQPGGEESLNVAAAAAICLHASATGR